MNNIVKGSSIALIFIALSGCGSDDNDSTPTPTPTPQATTTQTPDSKTHLRDNEPPMEILCRR
ncbi:hypothetical protein KTH85_17780, partial [Acinetobacter oleivorans]|uniref:hypothetical protein n=1 Tax=Acinetobacter oleivorans TaxID=1148157 RepID=UPI0021CFC28C